MIFIQEVLHAPAQSLISISLLQQNGSDPADELLTAKNAKISLALLLRLIKVKELTAKY